MKAPHCTPATLAWLRQQVDDPAPFYSMSEWRRLTGLPAHRLRRAFLRKFIITKKPDDLVNGRTDRPHHIIATDDAQRLWPAMWRSVKKRVAGLTD